MTERDTVPGKKRKEEKKEKAKSIDAAKANVKKVRSAASKKRKKIGSPKAAAERLLNDYDPILFMMVVIFVIFGITMVFSAGYYSTLNSINPDPYYYLKKQVIYAAPGFVFMYIFAQYDYHKFTRWADLLIVVSLGLLALLFTPLGITVNFATRWISVFGIRITPSEISKIAIIIFTSVFLAKDPSRARDLKRGILPLLAIAGIHAAMIIKQPNLSTAIVICAITLSIMFVAGIQMRYVAALIGLLAAGITYILLAMHHTHWYARLTNWVNPFADSQGEGYQVSQSLIALGNGGIKGLGLGHGVTKNLYLPEPQNDFILAVIGEELGMIGIVIMMVCYLILIWRCFTIAANAKDKLGIYMASGIASMVGLHVILNIAVVTASMPATGITLPFVSYGGTSICIFLGAMGIMMNIAKQQKVSADAPEWADFVTPAEKPARRSLFDGLDKKYEKR